MSLTSYHEPGVGPAAPAQPNDAQAGEHVNPAGHPAADVPPAHVGVHGGSSWSECMSPVPSSVHGSFLIRF